MDKDNTTRPYKGLHTDNSFIDSPKETYRYALNAVNETELGDFAFLSNEESNALCDNLSYGFIPLGKVYIGDNQLAIFSVSQDETISEIGILDDTCNYVVHVNDEYSEEEDKLNFRVENQIQAIYRLRRGCERTVYFTDNYNKPRYFNFDKPEDFKDCDINGDNCKWVAKKFELFKTYTKIPIFDDIEILEGGTLTAGSYNAAIQYLDEDFNPTEWITTTDTIMIYNDGLDKPYSEIRGSTNAINDYQDFGATNKSIKFTFNPASLDKNFAFYRIGVIKADNGSGQVSKVLLSQEISTEVPVYNFTGEAFSEGTEEEIQLSNSVLETAGSIEQIENRLILGNTKGKNIDFCALQKYASKIKSDVVLEEIILNAVIDNNPKNGLVHTQKVGYMPGELYSFGIVYIFEDGYLSPVYHIPGRNPDIPSNVAFTAGTNIKPMAGDNECKNSLYTDASGNCSNTDYWGLDSEGVPLINKPIRHHRFPLRSAVGEALVTENSSESISTVNRTLKIHVSGSIDPAFTGDTIYLHITYLANGVNNIRETAINVATYNPVEGLDLFVVTSTAVDLAYVSTTEVKENGEDATVLSGLTYTDLPLEETEVTIEKKLYISNIFGIRFSGINLPTEADTNGNKIIGYYIVRNERTNNDKTILDSAIITPLIREPERFAGSAHLMPELADQSRVKDDIVALINPEFKFFGTEHKTATQLIKEGEFQLAKRTIYTQLLDDVQPGTSYDSSRDKKRERDTDGFSLHTFSRNNQLTYKKAFGIFADEGDIDETFYLAALFNKSVQDLANETVEVFNVAFDNKVGIVKLNSPIDREELFEKIPYVVMKRELDDPYSTFRVLPYYKESKNYHTLTNNILTQQCDIFNGDVYISSMKYTNTVFYDIRLRKRFSKKGIINTIVGVILAIVGAILIITGYGAVLGVMLIGFAATQIAAGVKKDQIAKVYSELYDAGLKDCVDDDTANTIFSPNPPDDEIEWFSDTLSDVWFESTANANWRKGSTIGMTDFLNAPASVEGERLNSYIREKLTVLDTDADDGRLYKGFANAELYEINEDYRRRNKQKIFYHLGVEYDCCSDCTESFPHRVHYSEQSFQEELTDNYRTFLPNNYRDIEGESGPITNIFKLRNDLFIHTKEALYNLPRNYQERVTDQIVSFIGTGSFFEIPPQKIIDDDTGSSAGLQHKWSSIKTPYGIVFVSENQRKIYIFDGREMKAISNTGMSNWFKENLNLKLTKQYLDTTGKKYPYDDNPSNPFGVGFITTYDTKKERVIVTKKDFTFSDEVINTPDFNMCIKDGHIILFEDFNQIIQDEEADGWRYVGIEDCRLKFERTTVETTTEERVVKTNFPNDIDIVVQLDYSGSFDEDARNQIKDAIDDWRVNFSASNPDWTGSLYYVDEEPQDSEYWIRVLQYARTDIYGGSLTGRKILAITFVNECTNGFGVGYHSSSFGLDIDNPTALYLAHATEFIVNYNNCASFNGLAYPIVSQADPGSTNEFLKHTLAALKGVSYTTAEANILQPNPYCPDWNKMKNALKSSNPYPNYGLENYGWSCITNRGWDGSTDVLTPEQFQIDMDEYLEGFATTETIEVEVDQYTTEYKYIDGSVAVDPIDNNTSWTLSYSMKQDSWTSWHSYLPNFYMNVPEKFYSWKYGGDFIWKHGVKESYQTFYGQFCPHIIEYTSLSTPLVTRIWNHIKLITEAKKFNATLNQYYDERFITFNKLVVYNSRQCSGELELLVKDIQDSQDYMSQQIINTNNNSIIIDRTERDWFINDLRDIRINYNTPIWDSNINSLQPGYFKDKILNTASLNVQKDWTQLESFRDKYLVIRLIFDNFADVKLITNYSVENEQQSFN